MRRREITFGSTSIELNPVSSVVVNTMCVMTGYDPNLLRPVGRHVVVLED